MFPYREIQVVKVQNNIKTDQDTGTDKISLFLPDPYTGTKPRYPPTLTHTHTHTLIHRETHT